MAASKVSARLILMSEMPPLTPYAGQDAYPCVLEIWRRCLDLPEELELPGLSRFEALAPYVTDSLIEFYGMDPILAEEIVQASYMDAQMSVSNSQQ